jgi:hypothetical protein
MIAIIEKTSQNVTTKIAGVEKHRSTLYGNDLKCQRATDISAL